MLALYRSGRQAEALASYQAFRRTLADELGIEPSAALRELERRMLRQDATLDLPARRRRAHRAAAAASPSRRGRRRATRAAATSASPTRSSATGRSTSCSCTAGSAPSSPAGRTRSSRGFYRRLASFGRLILFDKRGTGLSDRVSPERLPDLETRMDDVRAVMDAVGSERAVVLGISEGGAMSALFAATYPERTRGARPDGHLRAGDAGARTTRSGVSEERAPQAPRAADEDDWATAVTQDWLGRIGPELLHDPARCAGTRRTSCAARARARARAIRQMNAEIDIRDVLPTISVPTLVLHRADEYCREATRFMGERIPGRAGGRAAGQRPPAVGGRPRRRCSTRSRSSSPGVRDDAEPDRVLATVLFTDIVGSTERGGGARRPRLERAARAPPRGSCARSSRASAAARSTRPATASSPPSTARPARPLRLGDRRTSVRDLGLEVRAGVHTGEIELIGRRRRAASPSTSARASRAAARPGEVLVSSTVKDLVAGLGHRLRGARRARAGGRARAPGGCSPPRR